MHLVIAVAVQLFREGYCSSSLSQAGKGASVSAQVCGSAPRGAIHLSFIEGSSLPKKREHEVHHVAVMRPVTATERV